MKLLKAIILATLLPVLAVSPVRASEETDKIMASVKRCPAVVKPLQAGNSYRVQKSIDSCIKTKTVSTYDVLLIWNLFSVLHADK
jgi:hypothetical protein